MPELPNFVPGHGPASAKLMIVGEAPGADEDEARKTFVGKTGNLTREMLKTAGINLDDCYRTNVEKYRPPGNKLSRLKEIGRKPFQDLDLLRREVEALQPNAILALGNHAFKACASLTQVRETNKKSQIRQWRGSIIKNRFTDDYYPKVIPTYHPSALLRSESEETKTFSYSARAYMQHDFNRAVEESKTRGAKLPERDLIYAQTDDDLARFFNLYRQHTKVSIDIETTRGSCIPTCIGFAFTKDHGISVPLLNVDKSFFVDPRELVRLWRRVQDFLLRPEIQIIGQNFKFDHKKLRKPCGFKINAQIYFDTGMCAHVLYPEFPKALEFLASVWTREPYYKDELRTYDPTVDDFTRVLYYNAKDCCVPFEIYEKMHAELEERDLESFFFDKIMPLHHFYMDMEERGMAFNGELQKELRERYTLHEKELEDHIEMILGYHLQIGAHGKVAKALFEDLALPRRKNVKEDTLVALLANHCQGDQSKYSVVSNLLELRKVKRTKNGPLSSPADYDGRMRTIFNISGAANGRTSANLVKPPERPKKLGFQAHNQSKHGEIGPELREMYEPDKGKVLVQIDKSQAEARVVAALAKDEWLLSLFDNKKDVHSITASWFFNLEDPEHPEDPIGITKDMRFIGKTGRHALAYDCKEFRLMMTINKQARKFGIAVNVSQSECKGFRQIFHQRSPKIRENFYREVIAEINKSKRTLVAASGRPRQFFGLWDPNLYYSYIPSASVSDDTKFHSAEFKRRVPQLETLIECHDSLLFQCLPCEVKEFSEIGVEIFETPMDLSRCSLPRDPIIIPADVEVGENYKDLRKVA